MTTYTVYFYIDADWTSHAFDADTAEEALAQARAFALSGIWELNFESYHGASSGIEHIEVFDFNGRPAAEWRDSDLLLRQAASELLTALEQAVAALNTEPRFRMPSLDLDSYQITSLCDSAIAKAKAGVS